jgi:hypothetical protein
MSGKVIAAAGVVGVAAGYYYMQQQGATKEPATHNLAKAEPNAMQSLMANAGSSTSSATTEKKVDRQPKITTAHLQKMLDAARATEKECSAELKSKRMTSQEYGSRFILSHYFHHLTRHHY